MHKVILLFRSSIVPCTNGKVNQTTNVNAAFFTAVVCYAIGTKHYGFSGLWDLRIVIVPPDFL